jgi:hypothetical protein
MLADLEGVNHSYDSSSSGFDLPHPLPVWWRKGRLAMVEEGRGIFDQCWRGVKEERNAGREQRTVIEGRGWGGERERDRERERKTARAKEEGKRERKSGRKTERQQEETIHPLSTWTNGFTPFYF